MYVSHWRAVAGFLVLLATPALATVQIESMTPSLAPPQGLGATINWTVTATDSKAGPLTFQFNVAPPSGSMALVKDFNVGTYSSGVWTAQTFAWLPLGPEGAYQIEVVAKDFTSGETSSSTFSYQVNPLATGTTPVVAPSANPLVAFLNAPPCAKGSTMRAVFAPQSGDTPSTTAWISCRGSKTITFELAGMRQLSNFKIYTQTNTGGSIRNGTPVPFKTGALPTATPVPTFTVNLLPGATADTAERYLLEDLTLPGQSTNYPEVVTNLAGQIVWYYYPPTNEDLVTRPISSGILAIESGPAWNSSSQFNQMLRQIDWPGNIVKETNVGVIQQQLLALGATDAQPCSAIARPAPVGAGCLDDFDHDFIRTLPNGYSAVLADTEKIYPAGTQGDTSGLPVDIIGNMIIVLDSNWQVVWYFDTFEHAGGAPQLDINRGAVLNELCSPNQLGCPPGFLLGSGIAPLAHDWLHSNSIYYWPAPQDGASQGDLIFSARHQDWVMRIDYKDGAGTGNILWRMGNQGDFSFNNITGDPWPWFSHQHEAGIENTNGFLDLFDNGNTRVDQLGSSCAPNDCNSRGMVLSVDEASMQVTPVLSDDLGVYSSALGSAQLLPDGNYAFMAGFVGNTFGYEIEVLPTSGKTTGTQVYNLGGTVSYRAWRMTSLYDPPTS